MAIFGTRSIYMKVEKEYILLDDMSVLKSTAASIIDDWSVEGESFSAVGGGIQVFSPQLSLVIQGV